MRDHDADVVLDTENNRFLYEESGMDAQLRYHAADGQLILLHAEVPEALGGRGIAGRLVRAAAKRAQATGETVLPWCPYTRQWLQRHPDVARSIAIDWSDPPFPQDVSEGAAG